MSDEPEGVLRRVPQRRRLPQTFRLGDTVRVLAGRTPPRPRSIRTGGY